MNNCQIIIKRQDHHTVSFSFDDFRVAQAIINLLDNVAESQFDNEIGMFVPQFIKKDIHEE